MEALHCLDLKTSQIEKINWPENVMLLQHSWKFHPTLNPTVQKTVIEFWRMRSKYPQEGRSIVIQELAHCGESAIYINNQNSCVW